MDGSGVVGKWETVHDDRSDHWDLVREWKVKEEEERGRQAALER